MKLWVQKTLFLMTLLFPDLILVPQEREHPTLKMAWFCPHSFFQGHLKVSCLYQPVLFQNNFEIHNVYGRWPSTSLQKRGYEGIKVFLLRVTKHSRIEQEINQAPEIKPECLFHLPFPLWFTFGWCLSASPKPLCILPRCSELGECKTDICSQIIIQSDRVLMHRIFFFWNYCSDLALKGFHITHRSRDAKDWLLGPVCTHLNSRWQRF